jgi:hypothetical protein
MRKPTVIAAKLLFVMCNGLVLFEEDVLRLLYPLAWYFI